MFLRRKFDLFLLALFFVFSVWLFNKSFGYNSEDHVFRIARHQIGDFGLHLSLIRSFSWGNNFPPESPFFPGIPLPYHYYYDLIVGLLERVGVRIDYAFNGLSVFAFTAVLFLLYRLPQVIFIKSKLLGLLSVSLFLLHPSFTFVDFLKNESISLGLLKDLWYLPDYIHKGPFDGSLTTIFFTLNVYLNQRHLVLALAVSLGIFYLLIGKVLKRKSLSTQLLVFLGIVLGFMSRIHTLIFLSTLISLTFIFLFFKQKRALIPLLIPASIIFGFHLKDIMNQEINHSFLNPGFLAEKPLTAFSFLQFWILNTGASVITIPLGYIISNIKQKKLFLTFLPLFITGNLFQLGFRIDHNHSLFNLFFLFANFYTAYFLLKLWRRKIAYKLVSFLLVFLLLFSGVINLMAVKNDFQYRLGDVPTNFFMNWIRNNTKKDAIFLSRQEIFDPVTLSGRRNYLGHSYYLSVMGYNFLEREKQVKAFFEVNTNQRFNTMRKEGIDYLVIPNAPDVDFPYKVDPYFLRKNLSIVYEDKDVIVFGL